MLCQTKILSGTSLAQASRTFSRLSSTYLHAAGPTSSSASINNNPSSDTLQPSNSDINTSANVISDEVHTDEDGAVILKKRRTRSKKASGPDEVEGQPPSERGRKRKSALSSTIKPRINPFESVENWLQELRTKQLKEPTPTLDDIERFRRKLPPNLSIEEYAVQHNGLSAELCRAFSRSQMKAFGEMYNLDPSLIGRERTKLEIAEFIMEKKWGWPSLTKALKRERENTEIAVKEFPLKAHELFLVLGKDGSDLHSLSREFRVQATLSYSPLGLRIKGSVASLRGVDAHIARVKAGVKSETLEVPLADALLPRIVQNISRVSGVFFETVVGAEQQVRFFTAEESKIPVAARLAISTALESQRMIDVPTLSYLPKAASKSPLFLKPSKAEYSLYPFLTTQPLPLAISGNGVFRLRRVGDWLEGKNFEPDSLTYGANSLLTVDQDVVDLGAVLLKEMDSQSSGGSRKIIASPGHVLFTSTSLAARTFIPPVPGSHGFSKALSLIEGAGLNRSFVTNVPPAVLDVAPSDTLMVRRLIYQLARQKNSEDSGRHFENIISLEIPVKIDDGEAPLFEVHCSSVTRKSWNIIMPHRQNDLKIMVTNTNEILGELLPEPLNQFAADFKDFYETTNSVTPVPPSSIWHGGQRYNLVANENVRRSTRKVVNKLESDFDFIEDPDKPSQLELSVVSERVKDAEVDLSHSRCEVSCSDVSSREVWLAFLRNCDYLTTSPVIRQLPESSTS